MAPSFFYQDLNNEQILSRALDQVYRKLGIDFERRQSSSDQNRGIDLHVKKGSSLFLVDEKAQLDYLNKSLPTFAFELGYFNSGVRRQGWLFDLRKETTHYILVTDIMLKDGSTGLKSEGDVRALTITWLNRSKLISFLSERNITVSSCLEDEGRARQTNIAGRVRIPGKDGIYYFLSLNKSEKPFNLIIDRNILCTIGNVIHEGGLP